MAEEIEHLMHTLRIGGVERDTMRELVKRSLHDPILHAHLTRMSIVDGTAAEGLAKALLDMSAAREEAMSLAIRAHEERAMPLLVPRSEPDAD